MADADSTLIRVCTKCGFGKPHSEYSKTKRTVIGRVSKCKACCAEYAKVNRARISELSLARYHRLFGVPQRKAREEERQAKRVRKDKRCAKCGETKAVQFFAKSKQKIDGRKPYCKACENEASRQRRVEDPSTGRAASERWRLANMDRVRATHRRYYEANKERISVRHAKWKIASSDKIKAAYERRRQRPEWRIKRAISSRIRMLLVEKAGRKTEEIIGYSASDLRKHIEKQFLRGMSWSNYGEWHIDHIVPVSAFNIRGFDLAEIRRAWALPNLRPLWAKDNIQKSAKRTHLI